VPLATQFIGKINSGNNKPYKSEYALKYDEVSSHDDLSDSGSESDLTSRSKQVKKN
jgi:hypothetical protein